jgi:hypothetical protein
VKPGRIVVGVAVFVIGLGVGLPPTASRTRSAAIAMASTRSSGLLASASEEYWQFLQKRNLGLRIRMGLPVEELPDLSENRAREDARFGASILEKLRGLREHELSHQESLSLSMLRSEATELAG